MSAIKTKLEADPNGLHQHQPGAKLDHGKPDASLLRDFARALLAVAEVGTFGATKYTRGGWQEVADGYNRYSAAGMRHFLKAGFEDYDADSGLLHEAHEAWNALAKLELKLRERALRGSEDFYETEQDREYYREYTEYAEWVSSQPDSMDLSNSTDMASTR